MDVRESKWLKIALINLSVVALIGVTLRYKIAFSLPYIDQKHLLHGHSHFAFSGWITMALMTFMVGYLQKAGIHHAFDKYKWLLISNLVTAYGMLLAFPMQGYGLFSIIFSALSIFVSYVFAIKYWRDLNRLSSKPIIHAWFKAAVVFNSLSSIGAFSLAFMMAKHIVHQNWYLSAVYFFLHFQYNGWFFFACMGLFLSRCKNIGIDIKSTKPIYLLFVFACVPAYYLSALWMPMYSFVYVAVVLSAAAQVFALFLFIHFILLNKQKLQLALMLPSRIVLTLSCLALMIKLLLQLGSTHPALSQLAFGFRPIVIAYLHLVLLGVITIFLLGYTLATKSILINKKTIAGISVFLSGIILNEILLMVQGIAGIRCICVPYSNEMLLVAAVIMFSGTLLIVFSQQSKETNIAS